MTPQNRKFLIFNLHGLLFALDLAQVSEVCDPPRMWPIPMAPACYSGVLNFHGDIVAVMDLAHFFGLPGGHQLSKIIILHQKIASLAFLVDTVVRIVSEDEVSFSSTPDNIFAVAALNLIEGEAVQLDLEAIVSEAEITMKNNR